MHPIIKLVSQRLALGFLLLFGASALIFGLTEALPGDAAQAVLGQSATPESLANLREEMGLNRPALTRYFEWLGGIVQGDMGTSLTNKLDIAESVSNRLGNTLFLAFWAAIVSVPPCNFSWPRRGTLPQPLARQADLSRYPDDNLDPGIPDRLRPRLFHRGQAGHVLAAGDDQ